MFNSENMADFFNFLCYMVPLAVLIYLLIDLLKHPALAYREKINWLLALIFLPVIGWVIYLVKTRWKGESEV